ncbi:MAG: 3-hydroxyacyl-ACP dehydratase FabZ [Selenomonas sp.]|jgi:3-hydroxyacyl-[acyl-carrier-protein] dehydratase/UDP-3-O-[3-hydroxymyristoyl] N-acetylglucosamine deacetylase/3-hydroxyacyl-[acyl-carrier-protein] dehydratase|uniref:3-hydroxyacyl-ACP dehydratase FabZ n=1 Tax=Selenomonas sp. AE3005 TaxID=1485543 RepID=UPI00048402FD|nr:3-hydroxyacyl-ACP dehydratase FabZ [Selenomonas sp. AE3005]MBP3780054.1 3-hydroxyacyl-ACP dehydratase FabZ [Selenomonas sp.]MBQ1416850.1 3-hydroxyacyl-ACP dehydratase FabZ [Selenomonas sp.]MBQ1614733.1 3-hydroxyacyl-ACP dehydratase FabZ [Selenomonas sp.]MBQ1808423.1 3-hydroxyacyl-ACP dehydratase FabZ [Selenomonas sp.]MBQ1920079.1 3-hydroxyacyl-ACP dehydratase FabZ [Selenomonas sp.]
MELGIEEIMKILPHRAPMLLVDRIIEIDPFKSATGIKNITMNEPQFNGHFPGHPIMPGVLILEAMAQVGGVAMLYPEENRGKIAMFGGMENIKFKRPVVPGDQLVTKAHVVRVRGEFGLLHCDGYVDDQLVASADFKFAMKRESEM